MRTQRPPQPRREFLERTALGAAAMLAGCARAARPRPATPRHTEAQMQFVTSADGTQIAYSTAGDGPPLLLVHGATADHTTTWRRVGPALERRFTVHAMDRRGRGRSGDAPSYALQREAEDVAAVVDAIGGAVSVLGHSYGALCALEAAVLRPGLRALVLYEGIPLDGAGLYPAGVLERLEALHQAGDREGVLVTLYRDVAQLTAEELEQMRSQREAWAVRLRNAATAPRELRSEVAYRFDPARFSTLRIPTLLLVGGESPQREMDNARGVAAALPEARVAVLPGQQHIAMHTAPEAFVAEVTRFLQGQ